jgi:hypothetical protein
MKRAGPMERAASHLSCANCREITLILSWLAAGSNQAFSGFREHHSSFDLLFGTHPKGVH